MPLTLCLQEDSPQGVFRILSGHRQPVKAISFLPGHGGDGATYFVSGSDDGVLIVWKSLPPSDGDFEVIGSWSQHTAAINCLVSARVPGRDGRWIIASGAADSTMRIWLLDGGVLRSLQVIETQPKFFPLALSLDVIGGSDSDDGVLILAAGGTKDLIQIWTADLGGESSFRFHLQATLAGHEGWIRSLAFTRETPDQDADMLLASASQDKYVRLWRIRRAGRQSVPPGPWSDDGSTDKSPSNKSHRFRAGKYDFSITFEALLPGHEDWIYSARWCPRQDGPLRLLTASADNSLCFWEADASSGIWTSTVRLGEISREKGATTATGSTGGFWTGLWSPDGQSVACVSKTGSWRRWEYREREDSWRPCFAVSGHTKAVTGLSWSRDGGYLLSTSADQTTRLHARWTAAGGDGGWHEMSRPQIHGYDLNCIDALSDSRFVSGADEKLMRVFDEPRSVARMLHQLSGLGGPDVEKMAVEAADMPVLGLSNKAVEKGAEPREEETAAGEGVENGSKTEKVEDEEAADVETETRGPPVEDMLSRQTLWPETEKLYGHGYEISCLAASHDGRLIASACRASSANHAVIRIFETGGWTEVKPPLRAHTLTATRLRFCDDDSLLLSVGRDRQWVIFERDDDGQRTAALSYRLLQSEAKGHSRMILDAAWAPGRPMLFATAGRDRMVRLWRCQAEEMGGAGPEGKLRFTEAAALSCASPVTAIDFSTRAVGDGRFVLAAGTELGQVRIWIVSRNGSEIAELSSQPGLVFSKAVSGLAWRPGGRGGRAAAGDDGDDDDVDTDGQLLAGASEDSSLKMVSFGTEYLRQAAGGRGETATGG